MMKKAGDQSITMKWTTQNTNNNNLRYCVLLFYSFSFFFFSFPKTNKIRKLTSMLIMRFIIIPSNFNLYTYIYKSFFFGIPQDSNVELVNLPH